MKGKNSKKHGIEHIDDVTQPTRKDLELRLIAQSF